ncbi:hypothetical protein ACHAXR_000959, partial [Thalassiosira sp. AJA248-18]
TELPSSQPTLAKQTTSEPTRRPSSDPSKRPTPESSNQISLSANPAATEIPEKRCLKWSSLGGSDLSYASNNLGYDRDTWNLPGTGDIEAWSYHDLYDIEVAGAQGLGIDSEMWDCHINHYFGYWWEDIEYYGYDEYLTGLGWKVESWDNCAPAPDSEDKYWDELTPRQQAGATQVCYTVGYGAHAWLG